MTARVWIEDDLKSQFLVKSHCLVGGIMGNRGHVRGSGTGSLASSPGPASHRLCDLDLCT